ncbi:hypothetical protein HAT2_00153 [Candidatus Similichlamydia laticola]|uniref:Uncharacterized protein n=1 Tax=Candidatus Similichlamydia laticola TaxID=2170265 RepID=A0A369KJ16_9BACT|nr:hypothetical protein HAT2_00153 [Candidatus Similichlamydia laticola]
MMSASRVPNALLKGFLTFRRAAGIISSRITILKRMPPPRISTPLRVAGETIQCPSLLGKACCLVVKKVYYLIVFLLKTALLFSGLVILVFLFCVVYHLFFGSFGSGSGISSQAKSSRKTEAETGEENRNSSSSDNTG